MALSTFIRTQRTPSTNCHPSMHWTRAPVVRMHTKTILSLFVIRGWRATERRSAAAAAEWWLAHNRRQSLIVAVPVSCLFFFFFGAQSAGHPRFSQLGVFECNCFLPAAGWLCIGSLDGRTVRVASNCRRKLGRSIKATATALHPRALHTIQLDSCVFGVGAVAGDGVSIRGGQAQRSCKSPVPCGIAWGPAAPLGH